MFLGSIVNAIAVMIGSLIGILLKKNFPENIREIIFHGLGLCTLAIGITMVMKVENILVVIGSVLIGGIVGEILRIQEFFDSLGDRLKNKLKSKNESFTEGFVSAFLIFCVGAMTIMGAFEEGVRNDHTLLFTKSMLDGFCSIALGATLGSGVFFSAFLLLIFQGSLTLLAGWAQPFFTETVIRQITGTGGILVLAIGINLLQIKKIKVSNLLPALVFVVLITFLLPK